MQSEYKSSLLDYVLQWDGKTYVMRRTTKNRALDERAVKKLKKLRDEAIKILLSDAEGNLNTLVKRLEVDATNHAQFIHHLKEYSRLFLYTLVPKKLQHLMNKPVGQQPKEYPTLVMDTIRS